MKRSSFASKTQPANSARKKSLGAIAIVQFAILVLTITIIAAIVVQNLQPEVHIFFLGQKTLPIPLSVAMLVGFVGGGVLAFVINAIASWRHNLLIRRAVIEAGYGKEERKEQAKSSNPSTQQTTFQKDIKEDFEEEEEYDEEDEYDDELEEEEEELYDEEDDDPDTVPYGDRQNLKSAKPKQPKRDRPPLDAKFIK
ncbi:MAG: hypothetical protein DCF19_01575 [Pseudanabaena frigida]|uniref:DUF1049 domain-containing protein n=1 Tax=Pseudanabaena frigida TaxID=945775 RepID=A0A2W4WRK0_9CYAN|nr:MAG: hypothetical protein DCF19_01575 [Pseudanabaena frigida]